MFRRVHTRRPSGAALFGYSVALIGDSRITDAERNWKSSSSSDWKGLTAVGIGLSGTGVASDGTGTLEYKAADHTLRWTAPGDSAGPWTAMQAGRLTLESATAGKGLILGLNSLSGLPASDQTISVSISGSVYLGRLAFGFWVRAFNQHRWLNGNPLPLAIGGNTAANVVEQLPFINAAAPGSGWDVIQLGTNDISNSTASVTVIDNLRTIYDSRHAQGRRLVLVGEPARWGTAVDSPMSSGQQAIHAALNDFMATYAAAHRDIYVDAYAVTYDSGSSDRRPMAGILRDKVHYSERGAQIVGKAIADALTARLGAGPQRHSGSTGNPLSRGYMAGSSGTAGTGASGTVPTGWSAARASGSDAAVTCSVEARTDGIAGNWARLQCSSTTAGLIQFAAQSTMSLANLGLAIGDTIYIEAEITVTDPMALINVEFFCLLTGITGSLRANPESATDAVMGAERSVFRSPRLTIPSGVTDLPVYVWIRLGANASAEVRVGAVAIVKVT